MSIEFVSGLFVLSVCACLACVAVIVSDWKERRRILKETQEALDNAHALSARYDEYLSKASKLHNDAAEALQRANMKLASAQSSNKQQMQNPFRGV